MWLLTLVPGSCEGCEPSSSSSSSGLQLSPETVLGGILAQTLTEQRKSSCQRKTFTFLWVLPFGSTRGSLLVPSHPHHPYISSPAMRLTASSWAGCEALVKPPGSPSRGSGGLTVSGDHQEA